MSIQSRNLFFSVITAQKNILSVIRVYQLCMKIVILLHVKENLH